MEVCASVGFVVYTLPAIELTFHIFLGLLLNPCHSFSTSVSGDWYYVNNTCPLSRGRRINMMGLRASFGFVEKHKLWL